MTNTGGTPAGWYYAPGDPEGTQRYWDGAQWIGDPQSIAPQAPASSPPPTDDMTVQYRPPAQDSGSAPSYGAPGAQPADAGFGAPNYSAPGAAPPNYGAPGAPAGYQGFAPAGGAPGTYAEWGTRAIALLIDVGIGIGISIVGAILFAIGAAIADALGVLMFLVWMAALIAYSIWNYCIRQGNTGQTIGKEKQGIKLVKDDTGQPVGVGMAFVRYLLAGVLGGLCGIYTLLDYLWPLWDDDNKRITDKMVTMSVVTV